MDWGIDGNVVGTVVGENALIFSRGIPILEAFLNLFALSAEGCGLEGEGG